MAEGDMDGAVHELRLRNSLPAVCGRVCPQEDQCELACVLHKKGRQVAIGRLERYLGDYALRQEDQALPERPEPTGKKVAVIGSGPAGLTCAGMLAREGHGVTVFEALHKPGASSSTASLSSGCPSRSSPTRCAGSRRSESS